MAEIKYTKKEHIIHQQKANEEAFLAELANGDYTLANPLVKLNPYIICPLSAMILFKTPRPEEVTIIVKGKEPAGDIVHRFPAAYDHVLPVYGLYAGYDNTVEIVLQDGTNNSVTITTDPLMEGVPESTSIDTTAEYMGDNFVFLTASMRSWPVGYDYKGDLRWYCTENLAFDIKRIKNGHILVGTERLVKMPYFTTGLYEMNFGGKIFKEYVIPCGGYHHDQFQMEDGNILALTFDFYSGTVEDVCVLLDKDTGEILKKWDYKTVLPQHGPGSGSQTEEDWFHNNAVWYDKKTNSLTFSGRHEDAVINLDFETGELNWIIGDPENWPQEYVDKYFFTPVGDGEFDWQYEQHACVVLPDGDIMLFDNGHYRAKNPDNYIPNSQNFSRGVRYRIDTDKMTIEQVWQYGKERGAEFFSPYICNVEYYDEGHYMVHSGGIGYLDGKPCEGMAVMLAMQPETKDRVSFESITCELIDDEVVYELHVPANCYRAEKLPIYFAGEAFEQGEGQYLGGLIETETTRMKVKADETGEIIPEHYNASILEEEERIMVNAIYTEGEFVQILLVDENGETRRYPVNTVGQDFTAMCVGTFQKENPCDIDTFINKTGLAGPQTVKILCEDKIYETGIVINK